MLVYLDSNIVIYLIERPATYGMRAFARIERFVASGDELAVSDLTRLECRSHPIASGDATTLAQYDAFFANAVARVIPLSTAVIDRATIIRGQYRFKTPDALHLAAAVEAGSTVLLSNDSRLSVFRDLTVEAVG